MHLVAPPSRRNESGSSESIRRNCITCMVSRIGLGAVDLLRSRCSALRIWGQHLVGPMDLTTAEQSLEVIDYSISIITSD